MVEILPYVELNGAWSLPDTKMAGIWDQLVRDGTAKIVFSDGEVSTSQEFITLCKSPANLPAIVYVDKECSGIGWINGLHKDRGFAHYAFFKSQWGLNTEGMARALINYWLYTDLPDGSPAFPLNMLIGQTPVWNRKAVRFLKRIGFTVVGELPATPNGHGVVISYLLKESKEWAERAARTATVAVAHQI